MTFTVIPGNKVNPHNYAAAMLAWLYQCNPQVILEADIYRVLKLDETTRRVLLGCRKDGLLLQTPPKRKTDLQWKRINSGRYRKIRRDPEPMRDVRDLSAPKKPMPFNPRIARMMHLAGKEKQNRWA